MHRPTHQHKTTGSPLPKQEPVRDDDWVTVTGICKANFIQGCNQTATREKITEELAHALLSHPRRVIRWEEDGNQKEAYVKTILQFNSQGILCLCFKHIDALPEISATWRKLLETKQGQRQ